MLATVWIRLTLTGTRFLVNGVETERDDASEYFMFGPTGIVRFHTDDGLTALFSTGPSSVAMVKESSEDIMNILRKMRGTDGKLNKKKKVNARRKK